MNVNWKLVSAFATGAVLASGIVYFAVRPVSTGSVDSPKPVVTPAIAPKPVAAPPVAEIASASAPPPARVPQRLSRVPIREKPSPMPPPVRHQKEEVIARNDPPKPTPPVEPKPDPPPPAAAPAIVAAPAPAPPQNVPVQNVSLPAPNVEVRVPHTVTLAVGTVLPVRIGETLSSAHNQPGDTFLATLTQPLVLDGFDHRRTWRSSGGPGGGAAGAGVALGNLSGASGHGRWTEHPHSHRAVRQAGREFHRNRRCQDRRGSRDRSRHWSHRGRR